MICLFSVLMNLVHIFLTIKQIFISVYHQLKLQRPLSQLYCFKGDKVEEKKTEREKMKNKQIIEK